jgi:hypothetical protein
MAPFGGLRASDKLPDLVGINPDLRGAGTTNGTEF